MSMLNIRLTDQIEQQLSEEARRENRTRSEIARDALTWYLTEIEKKRFMDQLLEEAREAYANEKIRQEAREIAEEFLPLESEVLDIAEDLKSGKLQHEAPGEKWWK
ncbi:MAG: ribbon-helix-helix protein, CopG family [Nitrosomonas sp.]|jgi:predicted transcriptional regulator|uniref:ribbon-helix-helix protein, CopG family n=1 Tax=Nitrosomonas sp. TaxID=42353 RepID=UPI0027318950|nr:ribbon-helix-helix protein, CopG family [Nitrosomonas sp.]MBK6958334.1 ribbon-helix-helix protein, CopG family [Nitrosomonas sp.]MDP1549469.1 ribbon-helix-helix protein, CopG family [Nitrosomonas sp.]